MAGAAGSAAEQRLDGWTEMWDAAAPLTVRLADFLDRAQGVEMDPVLVLDWRANLADDLGGRAGEPAGAAAR